jgi:hypothetical protein
VANTIKVNTGDRTEVLLTDWRFLIRETRKIEPAMVDNFKVNAKRIGRPVEKAVQAGITNRYAISGMQPKVIPGRLTWGGKVPPKKTELRVDTRLRKKGKSLVSVWVMSPAVAVFDVARKYGKYDGAQTEEYDYSRSPTGRRSHLRNGQGRHMVDAMDRSRARKQVNRSRVVWPSGLKAVPQANAEILKLMDSTAKNINSEIVRNA